VPIAPQSPLEPQDGAVGAPVGQTRVGVVDEASVEPRGDDAVQRVMDDPVADGRGGDEPALRVGDAQEAVVTRAEGAAGQLAGELQHLGLGGEREPGDRGATPLAARVVAPRGVDVVDIDDLAPRAHRLHDPTLERWPVPAFAEATSGDGPKWAPGDPAPPARGDRTAAVVLGGRGEDPAEPEVRVPVAGFVRVPEPPALRAELVPGSPSPIGEELPVRAADVAGVVVPGASAIRPRRAGLIGDAPRAYHARRGGVASPRAGVRWCRHAR